MFPFDGKYLKIISPVTLDGIIPKIDDETGLAETKETHAPLTSRKYYEQQNETLPKHLRKKIYEIDSDVQKLAAEGGQEMVDKKGAPPALKPKKKKEESSEELL